MRVATAHLSWGLGVKPCLLASPFTQKCNCGRASAPPWAPLVQPWPRPAQFQILRLHLYFHLRWRPQKMGMCKISWGGPSRWRRSKMWKSPSSPQIHQKYIYMWNNSCRTPTEHWQKTSDFPKAVWLTGSLCSSQASGLSLWGGRAEFRTLDHQRLPGAT